MHVHNNIVAMTAFVLTLRSTTTAALARNNSSVKPSACLWKRLEGKSFSTEAGDDDDDDSASQHYTIGITGARGLIGTALQDELFQRKLINGKPIKVIRLQRGSQAETLSSSTIQDTLVWNPKATSPLEVIDPNALKQMDALIHLSGENISTGLSGPLKELGIRPWTDAKKQEILDSRVITTSSFAKAIQSAKNPKLDFLVASGVGAYGPAFVGPNAPDAPDESTDISQTKGFLAEVSRQWERAAQDAKDGSCRRVVHLRNGVVLSTNGGALAKLYPIFFLGGGGIVGSGQQYFPFISARDMARAMIHVLETPALEGPVNMCAPKHATNADFTKAMGSVMKRPTFLPFPSFAVNLVFGEMGNEVLCGGTKAQPKKLLDSGFSFLHPTVEEAVQSAVHEKKI